MEEVVEEVIDVACVKAGETFDEIADRLPWPMIILKYKPRDIGGAEMAKRIGDYAIELALENLDEEYGDPDGSYTGPTDSMKEAASKFGKAIVADYKPWMCEPTGEEVKVTRQEAKELGGSDENSM
jgi:hypothetical protein